MLSDYKEIASGLKGFQDLDPLMLRIDNAHHVLLGEASHGTHEYYVWRTRITKRLLLEKKFNFIAVEGDWPDCYRINRFIKGRSEEHTSELQSLMRISYAAFCLKKKT